MRVAKVIEVLVASPSDVRTERDVVRQVAGDWNSAHSSVSGVVLQVRGWETDATPAADAPQEALNRQLVAGADIIVAVFWSRLGTPTDKYASGTVEEIERSIAAQKTVLVYFSDAPLPPSQVDQQQYSEVKQYQRSLGGRVLYSTYSSIEDFKTRLTRDLARAVSVHGDSNSEARSLTGSRVDGEAHEVLALVLDASIPLSKSLPKVLAFAQAKGDVSIEQMSRDYMLGPSEHARASMRNYEQMPQHFKCYRITAYASLRGALNPSWMGWHGSVHNMLRYLQSDKNGRRFDFVCSWPVSDLESRASQWRDDLIAQFSVPLSHFTGSNVDDDKQVICYAEGSSWRDILASMRTNLIDAIGKHI